MIADTAQIFASRILSNEDVPKPVAVEGMNSLTLAALGILMSVDHMVRELHALNPLP